MWSGGHIAVGFMLFVIAAGMLIFSAGPLLFRRRQWTHWRVRQIIGRWYVEYAETSDKERPSDDDPRWVDCKIGWSSTEKEAYEKLVRARAFFAAARFD